MTGHVILWIVNYRRQMRSEGRKGYAGLSTDGAQLTFLQERNCDEVQGYFFSPPMAPDDFIAWLQGRQSEPLARVAMY